MSCDSTISKIISRDLAPETPIALEIAGRTHIRAPPEIPLTKNRIVTSRWADIRARRWEVDSEVDDRAEDISDTHIIT